MSRNNCKARFNPREHIQRIIRFLISRNREVIEEQLSYLGTYDPAVWESITRGFQKVINFSRLASQILEDETVIDWAQETLLRIFRSLSSIVRKAQNPVHEIRGLAKLARGAILIIPQETILLLSEAVKKLESIEDLEERVRSASYLLFEIGYMLKKRGSVFSPEKIPHTYISQLEKIAKEIAEKALNWVSYISSPTVRARTLAFLSEGMRNLNIVIQQGEYGVKWLDTNEAEAMASLALKEAENVDEEYEKAMIKVYVGYLFASLSYDLASRGEELFNDALKIALELIRKDPRKAGRIIGEIGYCKAFLGDDDTAETLFEEGVATSLKCPDWEGILTALNIAESAARARMYRVAAELLEDHILQLIDNLKDRIEAAALKGVAADIIAWIDSNWAARLAQNGAEELWTFHPLSISKGEHLYLIGLASAKSAFAEPDASWRYLDFLLTLLREDVWLDREFVESISPFWLGKAYSALVPIPRLLRVFKKALLETLSSMENSYGEEVLAKILIEVARGIGRSDTKFAKELLDRGIMLSLDKPSEPTLLGKALRVAEEIDSPLTEVLLNEIQRRAEMREFPSDVIDYLTKAIESARTSKGATKLAQASVDIIYEVNPQKISPEKLKRFLRVLKLIDPSWASEVALMIEEERNTSLSRSENQTTVKKGVKEKKA
ncbi:MAG: hypothetical protein ACTSX9_02905 [Candidatus Njordarchaeales archaeon]